MRPSIATRFCRGTKSSWVKRMYFKPFGARFRISCANSYMLDENPPKNKCCKRLRSRSQTIPKKNKCLNAKKTKSNKACDVCDDLKIQHSLKCNDECWSKVLGEVRHIHQHCWVLSQKHPMTQHIQGWTLKRKVPLSTVLRWFLKRNWYNSISIHTLLNSVNSNLENSNLWPMTYDLKCSIEIACT